MRALAGIKSGARAGLIAAGVATGLAAVSPAQATPAIWESSFGSSVVSSDDATANVNFGFNFNFLGNSYSGGDVSTNGFLQFGTTDAGCCDASLGDFLSQTARIAPAWYDQVTTIYQNNSVAGRSVLTWQGHEFSNTTVNTYQLQLFDTGEIVFGYDTLTPLEDPGGHRHHAIIGLTAGGGAADPGETDLSSALPTTVGDTIYEFFARGPNSASGGTNVDTFDVAGTNICFSPDGRTGFSVSNCGPSNQLPEPGALAVFGLGLVGLAVARRRRKAA